MFRLAVMALSVLLSSNILRAESCEQHFTEFKIVTSEAQREIFLQFSVFLLNGFSKDRSCILESGIIRCANVDVPGLQPGELKFSVLRDYYQQHWLESRVIRGHDKTIPLTATELQHRYNYLAWPKTVIEHSAIKQERRTIYRNPNEPRISVAVTDSRGEVEVAMETFKHSRNFEFYAYGEDGKLTNNALFPVGLRPAPGICVACHFNSNEAKVNRFIP